MLPKGLDLDRPKRTRTSFTAEQLYRLELEFQRCQYVVGRERTELARQLNLSETQVRAVVGPAPWAPCVVVTSVGREGRSRNGAGGGEHPASMGMDGARCLLGERDALECVRWEACVVLRGSPSIPFS